MDLQNVQVKFVYIKIIG